MIRTTTIRPAAISKALLLSASAIAMASVPAQAAEVLFSSNGVTEVSTGSRTVSGSGVLQVRLDSGATLSFVEGAEFTLNDDGSVTLHKGSVTVAGAGDTETRVIMPEDVEGRVGGTGNAATFTVEETGASNGHTLTGRAKIMRGRRDRDFSEGQMWASAGRSGLRRVISVGGQKTPDAQPEVLDVAEGGPAAAAENGLPVSLGDALAAAGASSDILAIARRVDAANGNPSLEAYPTGDLAALVALAANLEGAYGGRPFPAAQADIIRTYLGYLANGGSGEEFLTAYAGFLTQYLDLVRAGGLPSQFGGASQADINAFIAYQANLGALGNLGAQNRALAEAYLEFIAGGGNPDLFASQFTDLVEAYFAFVRGGSNPSDFTGASQELVDAYVAFLAESGLAAQLSAENQEILAAYLESGGFAFAETYAAALADYFAYLQTGGLPSASGDLTPEQLQAYLELLEGSGLFAQLLGEQAQFYADYLAFLQAGGDADDFGQLNANIFAGYASQLQAYYAFLLGGGLPSNFQGDPEVLNAYLAALDDAGALQAFLGANAGFFADYLAFLQDGGDIDAWSGLNANVFAGYADALNAYYTYLAQGGLPSAYTELTQDQIAAYVAALQAQGASSAFLAALSGFYGDYLAYLQGGGDPDFYLGLPNLNTELFADALDVFGQFLLAGGLPSDFTASDLETLALYLDALDRAGELGLIGSDRALLEAYFAFLATGANADRFAGLPIYADYAAALNAYYDFLAGGGLPANYGALTPQQVRDYLAALSAAGGFATQLGNLSDFYTAYFAHIAGGNDPATFSGLPVYADYVAALNAYSAFLANGGLPGDYTALPLSTIEAYLDALNAAGGFAAYGQLSAFFADYYAFVSGGGNPANYSGLPVYADYVAALNAYYAFLANGGAPSAYTALSLDTLEAYLAALAAAGGFAAYGDLNTFFADYYAFVSGGGTPDDFGGLPGAGGGITIPDSGFAYAGGFSATSGMNGYVASSGVTGWSIQNASGTIDANGVPTGFAILDNLAGDPVNVAGDERGVVGQFADSFLHYVILPPLVGDLPTSGTIDYDLIAATAPTYNDGRTDAGVFDASLTFGFGSTLTYGMDGTITMPDATYTFATPGRANDQLVTVTTNVNPNFVGLRPALSQTGDACTSSNCVLNIFGGFGGDEPGNVFGFSYHTLDPSASLSARISGSALFGADGNGGGGVPAGSGMPMILDQAGDFDSSQIGAVGFAGPYDADNEPVRLLDANGADATIAATGNVRAFQNAFTTFDAGTSSTTDISGNANFLIGRWQDGTVGSNFYADKDLTTAQGIHYMVAAPLAGGFALPTTGRVDYELLAATAPTVADGTQAPGRFEAGMSLLFGGANIGLGFEATVTIPDDAGDFTYVVQTPGGLADPSQSFFELLQGGDPGEFSFTIGNGYITASDGLCAGECRFNAELAAAGDDVGQFGMVWNALHPGRDYGQSTSGAAIFGATTPLPGSIDTGNPASTYVLTDQILSDSGASNHLDITAMGTNVGTSGYETNASGEIIRVKREFGPLPQMLIGTASNADGGSTASGLVRWTRWTDGQPTGNFGSVPAFNANQGYHILVGAPVTNIPASGTVNYELVGGTKPTSVAGNGAPGTLTSGSAAIAFGATPRIGIDLAFTQNGNDYTMFTTGGSADPGASNLTLTADGNFRQIGTFGQGVTQNGALCGGCRPIWEGFLAGDGATELALSYTMQFQGTGADRIIGAAAFQQSAGGGGNSGGSGGGQYTSDFTGTRDGIAYYTYTLGSLASGFGGSADLVNGELVNFTSILGTVSKGSASVVEAGDVGDLAWGRWVNGTVEARTIVGDTDTVVGANGGYHVMAGVSPTSLPSSGTVNYELIATTSPTDNLGSAPGTLTGDLAIAFGATSLVGYDFQMDIGGRGYSVSSEGGAANPGASATNLVFSSGTVIFTGNHNSILPGSVSGTGGACQFSCQVTIGGNLFGSDGGYAGVAMNVFDGGNGVQASGLAIFKAEGTNYTYNPYASAPQGTQDTAPTVAVAPPEWDRWEVGADNISAGNGMTMAAPGLEALATSGVQYSPEQLAQLEAFYASRNPVN